MSDIPITLSEDSALDEFKKLCESLETFKSEDVVMPYLASTIARLAEQIYDLVDCLESEKECSARISDPIYFKIRLNLLESRCIRAINDVFCEIRECGLQPSASFASEDFDEWVRSHTSKNNGDRSYYALGYYLLVRLQDKARDAVARVHASVVIVGNA